MKVLIHFCLDADIIECPDWSLEILRLHQAKCLEWLYDTKNNHTYWLYSNGKRHGCCFRSEAFVEWLNTFVLNLSEEKAYVIDQCISQKGTICRLVYPKDITYTLKRRRLSFMKWLETKDKKGNLLLQSYLAQYGEENYNIYAMKDYINATILKNRDDKAYVYEKQLQLIDLYSMPALYF